MRWKELVEDKLDRILGSLADLKTLIQQTKKTGEHIMSKVTDFADQEGKDFDALNTKVDGIVNGVAALDKVIQDFQNSPGTLSAADQAALDKIAAMSAALVTKAAAVDTTVPVKQAPPA